MTAFRHDTPLSQPAEKRHAETKEAKTVHQPPTSPDMIGVVGEKETIVDMLEECSLFWQSSDPDSAASIRRVSRR